MRIPQIVRVFPQTKDQTKFEPLKQPFIFRHRIFILPNMIVINYIVAILFIICWAVGFFTRMVGPVVHILLLAAFALILINILHNDSNQKNNHLIN